MTKLDAALLKLEGALDYTVDPRVRALIVVAQQAIEEAKQVAQRPDCRIATGSLAWKAINKRPNPNTTPERFAM